MDENMEQVNNRGCNNNFLGNLFGGNNQIIILIVLFLLFTDSGFGKCC